MLRRINLRSFRDFLCFVHARADPIGSCQLSRDESLMFTDRLRSSIRVLTYMHGRMMLLHYGAGAGGLAYGQVLDGLVGGGAGSESVGVEFVVLVGELSYFHGVAFLLGNGGLVKGEEVLFSCKGAFAVERFLRGAKRRVRRLVLTGAWRYGLAHLAHFR